MTSKDVREVKARWRRRDFRASSVFCYTALVCAKDVGGGWACTSAESALVFANQFFVLETQMPERVPEQTSVRWVNSRIPDVCLHAARAINFLCKFRRMRVTFDDGIVSCLKLPRPLPPLAW